MNNIKFEKIDDYRDIESINMYKQIKSKGGDLNEFLSAQKISARDNSRTPFQWDSSSNAGFSMGTPWLKVNPNYKTVNVATEERDTNSCLNYFRKIVKLRKDNLILVYGKYELIDKDNSDVYAYTRELNGKKLLVLLNFTNKPASSNTGIDMSKAKVLIDNYADASMTGQLKPYEAVVYDISL
jgi:oligo-1,6-glucosidase